MIPERIVCDAWLASAELPYDVLIPLLVRMNGSENIFRLFMEKRNFPSEAVPPACRNKLAEEADERRMNRMQICIQQHQIRSVTILDEAYPAVLRNISDPPGILFYKGNIIHLQKSRMIGMVGSRTASYAGIRAAKHIACELSRNGVIIVSGLAYGIDTACHQGCLEGGSPTIAVMGCGLDQLYPYRNEPLKNEILMHDGLLISEYAPFSKAVGFHFPYRNRIISGLSGAVVLMEAKIRSGSMTTVDHALRQGKEVYAYPGDPTSPLTEGNRSLLRDGAHYFTEASEILSDMNWLDNQSYVRQNTICSTKYAPQSEAETAIYDALSRGTLGFDELVQATGLSTSELMSTLTVLQIRNVVEPLPGKKYKISQ